MKPRTYISGKITGLDLQVAREYFELAAQQLKEAGHLPVNPMEICPYNPEWEWHHYMAEDIRALLVCDAILMLENWRESKGARVEHAIAVQLGLKIFYSLNDIKKTCGNAMRLWTKEEDLDLWNNYKGDAAFFAQKYGVTSNVIVCRIQSLKKKGGVGESVYWTPEQEQILIDNWESLKVTEIAKLLNKSKAAISIKATLLRKKGIDLPIKNFSTGNKPKDAGTITTKRNGQIVEKQADGSWKYMGMISGSKKRGPVKANKPKPVKKPKITSAIRVAKPKPPVVEKKIKPFDPEGKVLVQINSKTWVYRKVS